ncbi:MAG TPA: undecaprenyldiphospho-muramoylpentapeptide beta-N-acetylglucosaminyltransferase [Gemmatimonadales bacterium]|nr:undecaprenyldiphospho-muramoylpentapeptide beta-N-acetylglucosaminyltransferase [Gemmatimonadales bacterium]
MSARGVAAGLMTGRRIVVAGGGTGGHLMPALALAQALRDARPEVELLLVGARRGLEAQVLPHHPFAHELLPIEPIYRQRWWKNARWLVIAPRVWRAVGRVLDVVRPALVIGTGGYAAGPVVWRAQRRGLPTVVQEQNALPGLTTRWLARRARQVHLGFPEARAQLRVSAAAAVFALGNPIRPPEPGEPRAARAALGLAPERPTLLVFGGSQGARSVNYAVAGALERDLFGDTNVLWGTGGAQAEVFARYAVPGRVVVRGFFDPMSLPYRAADLVVARAGAMTVAELCAWGKASILIPLASAALDHQSANARALAAAGAAVALPEPDLSAHTLARHVTQLLADPAARATLASRARARGHPNAAREIVSHILTLLD